MIRWCAILLLWLAAVPVPAQTVEPVASATAADGRYFGHLPYPEISRDLLAGMADSFAPNKSCELHRDAAPSLYRLMWAAQAAGITGLRAISCFRSVRHQQILFCGAGAVGTCRDPADRARSVAPGGYSEHATGYVVDFGAPAPAGCGDLDPCMSGTPGGLWLMANAPRYGFELSFPPGNRQGVTWEPWHWRWVGASDAEPGAAAARTVFARARAQFPGDPAVAASAAPSTRLRPVDPRNFVGPRD